MVASKDFKRKPIYLVLISTLIIVTGIAVYSYFFDCIINFDYAIRNANYLLLYFVDYLIFRGWVIVIAIICYGFLFKATKPRQLLVVKGILVVVISLGISSFFYGDDISLIIGHPKQIKVPLVYCLAALTAMAFYELKFK